MIRKLVLTLVMPAIIISCNGQMNLSENISQDTIPQKNIVVNKEYDEKGNLIRYDSTYSFYYSSTGENPKLRDSIFRNFETYFNQSYSFSNQPYFRDFFFLDSLLRYDFYKKDFFYERFKNNLNRMDSLFKEMDEKKNEFYNNQFKSGQSRTDKL